MSRLGGVCHDKGVRGALILLALACCLAPAGPQKRPARPAPVKTPAPTPAPPRGPAERATIFPLESLRVEGNKVLPAARIIAASGLRIGQAIGKEEFEAARNRLLATGAFEQVGYQYEPSAKQTGYDGVLQVQEIVQFFPYRFEDLPAGEDELRAAARKVEPLFEDKIPATKEVLARFTNALEASLAGKVKVSSQMSDETGELSVLFRQPGPRLNIAEVRFEGNDVIPSAALVRQIADVAIGIPYTEAAMRQRLNASIRPLYEARGRIRVDFPKLALKKAEKVDGVVVTVTIAEGETYKLSEIKTAGLPAAQRTQAEKLADWKKGDIANFDDVQAGVERIRKHYHSEGYLKVDSRIERSIDDKEHTVALTVAIDLGPQYKFGKLTIQGLDILSEPEIRKMWGPLEGKPYQPQYPEAFLARLREEQLFDNLGTTQADTKIDEVSKTVAVTLTFSGAPARSRERRPR